MFGFCNRTRLEPESTEIQSSAAWVTRAGRIWNDRDLGELEAALGRGAAPATARAWATASAIARLRRNAADVEDEWRLIAAKAELWLSASGRRGPHGASWFEAADEFKTR